MSTASDGELTSRAFAAYFRSRKATGAVTVDMPAGGEAVTEHDGKQYVVLQNVNGTLAVYRVRNDGKLKELKRWPAAVAGPAGLPVPRAND